MHSDPVSVDDTPPPSPDAMTPGRELAVRALLAGADCLQQRVSDLLGVSRRTIGRMADADLSAMLRDPQALEGARTCLADTASRGSTAEEREAAVAWLRERGPRRTPGGAGAGVTPPPPGPRPGAGRRPRRGNGAHRNGNGSSTATTVSGSSRGRAAPAGRGAPASAAAHSASQRARRLRADGRDTGRRTADDGGRAGRAPRRHHRGGAHDRDAAAARERAGKIGGLRSKRSATGVQDARRAPESVSDEPADGLACDSRTPPPASAL